MAIHHDPQSMSVEVIDEYFAIAEQYVNTRKENGGIYGYPAVLLLFCVIDALSNFEGSPQYSLGKAYSIFPGIQKDQLDRLKKWYRNLLVHEAIIMPGTQLFADPSGTPIEFNSDGEPVVIRVVPLFEAVKSAWEAFDRTKINPQYKPKPAPSTAVATVASPLPAASGCNVTTLK